MLELVYYFVFSSCQFQATNKRASMAKAGRQAVGGKRWCKCCRMRWQDGEKGKLTQNGNELLFRTAPLIRTALVTRPTNHHIFPPSTINTFHRSFIPLSRLFQPTFTTPFWTTHCPAFRARCKHWA